MKSEGNTSWRGENYLVGQHNTGAVDAEPAELGLQKYGQCVPVLLYLITEKGTAQWYSVNQDGDCHGVTLKPKTMHL